MYRSNLKKLQPITSSTKIKERAREIEREGERGREEVGGRRGDEERMGGTGVDNGHFKDSMGFMDKNNISIKMFIIIKICKRIKHALVN